MNECKPLVLGSSEQVSAHFLFFFSFTSYSLCVSTSGAGRDCYRSLHASTAYCHHPTQLCGLLALFHSAPVCESCPCMQVDKISRQRGITPEVVDGYRAGAYTRSLLSST